MDLKIKKQQVLIIVFLVGIISSGAFAQSRTNLSDTWWAGSYKIEDNEIQHKNIHFLPSGYADTFSMIETAPGSAYKDLNGQWINHRSYRDCGDYHFQGIKRTKYKINGNNIAWKVTSKDGKRVTTYNGLLVDGKLTMSIVKDSYGRVTKEKIVYRQIDKEQSIYTYYKQKKVRS